MHLFVCFTLLLEYYSTYALSKCFSSFDHSTYTLSCAIIIIIIFDFTTTIAIINLDTLY